MITLSCGANTTIPSGATNICLSWRPGHTVDVCALLLGPHGKVFSDTDIVFFNQPEHPAGVRFTHQPPTTATITMDLSTIPTNIDKIVIGASLDSGVFTEIMGIQATVISAHTTTVIYPVTVTEPVSAMIIGEVYRRSGTWKFRAVGQGWDSGLAALVTHYGITVDDEPSQTPAQLVEANWYPDPTIPQTLRWWDGSTWTAHTVPALVDTDDICGRCGGRKNRPGMSQFFRLASAGSTCGRCEAQIRDALQRWSTRLWEVLSTNGPSGDDWDRLWIDLRYQRIAHSNGIEILRPLALQYLRQLVTFAFADDVIEEHEVRGFEDAVKKLSIAGPEVENMRFQLQRGLKLSTIISGDLPRVKHTTLHLEAGEILHLDVNATHVRLLASGPRRSSGRLVVSDRKLRFLADTGGSELAWTKIMEARAEYGRLVVAATTARGGGTYEVDDSDYVAAVVTGALRIAKRLVVASSSRDSRAIPAPIKVQVWQRDGGKCVECAATEYLEFDHIIPWSRGGATSADNLQILCRRCNLAKGARI